MLFRGIPTTMSAGLVSVLILSLIKHGNPVADTDMVILVTASLATGLGLLMVSNLPLPKFKRRKMKWFSYFQNAMAGVLIILAFMRRMPEVLLASAIVYTIGGIIVGVRFERSFKLAQERRLGLAQEAERALERISRVDDDEDEDEEDEAEVEEGIA
jgi:phosphatidylserine synthase